MNPVSQQIVDQFKQTASLSSQLVETLDKQISWLQGLRDAMQKMKDLATGTIEQIETGKIKLDDPVETGAALKKFVGVAQTRKLDGEPLWKRMERLMATRARFTMTEVGIALEQDMGRSLGKNRPQTVRNNLIRHSETFRPNDDGTYTVITSLSANEEEAPIQETS
jgi:hypothetical protein